MKTTTDFSTIPDDEREDGAWTDFVVWMSNKVDTHKSMSSTWRAFKAGWHACHVGMLLANKKASR